MPLGGEGEVGTVQEFGADPGAAGGHLLHSGGSTVKRRLLAPVWVGGPFIVYFPLESSTEQCSGSLLMGGRVNPWSGRNNPQCSPGPASPLLKVLPQPLVSLGQSLGTSPPLLPARPTVWSWPHGTPQVAGWQHGANAGSRARLPA